MPGGACQPRRRVSQELERPLVEGEDDRGRLAGSERDLLERRELLVWPETWHVDGSDVHLDDIRSLVDAGIRVPEEVAVIGCDNLPVSELFTPRLTTVDVDMSALGTEIADTLHEILSTGEGLDVVPVPQVVIRDSA